MLSPQNLPSQLISIVQAPQFDDIWDLHLHNLPLIAQNCHQLECHIVVCPYHRAIQAADFHFMPFEEYINDLASKHTSTYRTINDRAHKYFGLSLGAILSAFIGYYNPKDLLTVEGLIGIFGAYLLGKHLWGDLARFLELQTQNWRLRFTEQYYAYELHTSTTIATYNKLAKQRRYGRAQITPQKIDFIEHSNSQTLRLCFSSAELKAQLDETYHLLSIHVNKDKQTNFSPDNLLLGLKLSFNTKKWFGWRCFEVFQSLDGNKPGCITTHNTWIDEDVFYRITRRWKRLKYFKSLGVLNGIRMFK